MADGGSVMFRYISKQEAIDFLLPRHYSGRKPPISFAFGDIIDNEIKAVCTFGKPPSDNLCYGVCGHEFSKYVIELNRLCREDDYDKQLSEFVGYCLRELKNTVRDSSSGRRVSARHTARAACSASVWSFSPTKR